VSADDSLEKKPKVFGGIKILSDLSAEDLRELEHHCRYKTFSANEQVFDRQSTTRDVFFVVKGKVRVVNFSLSGREITLDDIHAGSHFGELAALDGQPRSANVMALEDTLIVALPPNHFISMLEKHPAVALRVMRHLAKIVRISTERIMDLSTLGANNRVHADLLRQAKAAQEEKGQEGENIAIIKPIPVHSDVANRVSTTRETVARVLNDLARKGIVERQKDCMVVKDVSTLEGLVEEVRGE
jgi:CRP/FNR family transcriptional regulator, cyclic AMP receptor protein